jgi:hypothetical protein
VPALKYRDPATGDWILLPGVLGPPGSTGSTGPTGPIGPTGPGGSGGSGAVSTDVNNLARLGTDGQLYVPDEVLIAHEPGPADVNLELWVDLDNDPPSNVGATGPTGPTGAGATGPTGPAGVTGATGASGSPSNYTWMDVVNPATDVRPGVLHVLWVGGVTQPTNMTTADLWVKG